MRLRVSERVTDKFGKGGPGVHCLSATTGAWNVHIGEHERFHGRTSRTLWVSAPHWTQGHPAATQLGPPTPNPNPDRVTS